MDVQSPFTHAHGAVIGESDEIDEANEVRSLDRVPSGYLQDAVSIESQPRGPEIVEQGLGKRRGGRVVVLGHDRRQPEDRRDGCPGVRSRTAASAFARWIASLAVATSAGSL